MARRAECGLGGCHGLRCAPCPDCKCPPCPQMDATDAVFSASLAFLVLSALSAPRVRHEIGATAQATWAAAASQEAKGALVAGLVCCACVAGHVLLGVGDQDGPCAAVLRVLPSSLFPCLLMAATAAGVTALEAWHGDPRVLAGPCGDGRGVDASPLTYTGPRKKDGTPDRRFKVGREWARRHAAM